MTADLHLAIAHHLLVFALAGLLFAELVLVRPGLSGDTLRRVSGLDRAYGAVATLVFVVGVARLIWGAKGWDYYSTNPWFWAKMATFVAVGLLTIPPTLAFVRWSKSSREMSGYAVRDTDVAPVRRFIHIQLVLFFLIPVFAAAMARY